MDKALKQRLVGAIVLIILAVIVLPMLLSGRSETLKQESRKIEVPPKPDELSIETRRFPIGVSKPLDAEAPETAVPGLPSAGEEVTVPVDHQDEPSVSADSSASSPSTGPGPGAPASERVEGPPAVTRIKLPGAGVEPAATPPLDADEAGAPRYLVQVGSFSSEKRANALAQRLRKQDLAVVMDVVDRTAGRLHRVRVGPYARREDADAVVTALRDDADPELNELAPRVLDLRPDDSAPVTTPSDPLVRWVVQVGSFNEATRADALVRTLRQAGLAAFSEPVTSVAGITYKVRVGPEINRERAVTLMRQLKQDHGLNDSFVTTSE